MALRVQQLNADTTFLLTFTPTFAPEKTTSPFPGDFNILIDPWLKGISSILHPSFQMSRHVNEPAIESLKAIQEQLNLIIISQDKPDHCHRETLCSLPSSSRIDILATPAAARKIKSWRHFDPDCIRALRPYDASADDSIVRIAIPGYVAAGNGPGLVTITNMPAKKDMTGLHNAIGITYQPPSSTFTLHAQAGYETGTKVQLSANGISRPTASPQRPLTANGAPVKPLSWTSANKRDRQPYKTEDVSHTRADSGIAMAARNAEKTISILYTPHGLPSCILKPYLTHHLTPLGALPVLALFHSMTIESNPWFMGGKVSLGAPGGVRLAKALGGVQYWIGAHDEEKENLGLATKWIKSQTYGVEDVGGMLAEAVVGETMVMRLDVGERVRLPIKTEEKLKMNRRKNVSMPNLPRPIKTNGLISD